MVSWGILGLYFIVEIWGLWVLGWLRSPFFRDDFEIF